MTNRPETLQDCYDLVEKLQGLRLQQVSLDNQIRLLEQKKRLNGLDLKRLEAKKILEVEQAKQVNGQPIVRDIQVKRAMVEDLLSQDKTAITLLHKVNLIDKHIQRKSRKYGVLSAEVHALESKEKILLLGVR